MIIAPERAAALMRALEAEQRRRLAENRLPSYRPYPKQVEFHSLGAVKRERMFMAGNQLGKTWSGAYEASMHLTGRYPEWWRGRRWDRPTVGWVSGVTSESLRDTMQRLLMGRPGEWGTGTIPKACIEGEPKRALGVADTIDTVRVRHVSGGISSCGFKSYEKGREKWQGETLDWLSFDEEPPLDIYIEGLTRTNATGGMVWLTFTPLLGMSEVVKRFLDEQNDDRVVVKMTIEDVLHYTPEERARIIASYPEHERKARAMGEPVLGSGAVFPIAEERILVEPFPLPDLWPRIAALDFGWDHPTAAAWLAWDRDKDIVYLYDCFKRRQETPAEIAPDIIGRGPWIPVAWPHDGLQHEKGSGATLAQQYRDAGVNMRWENAQFEDVPDFIPGGVQSVSRTSVEAGILMMLQRMQTGRFKVFSNLEEWRSEFRRYHRKDGKIVKVDDDAISASRYALMDMRYAIVPPDMSGGLDPKRDFNWRV